MRGIWSPKRVLEGVGPTFVQGPGADAGSPLTLRSFAQTFARVSERELI
jgi:hypothetical protein